MDNLPIPNMRSSWVAALINTIFMFLIYYLCLFGPLLKEYRDHFDHDRSFDKSAEQLAVWVDVPRYFYAAGPATVHIHVKNETKKPFNDVKVYLITRADPKVPTLLIPNVFNADVYSSLVEFPIIEPLSTANGRVSFITQANTSITSVLLKVGDDEPQQLFAEAEIPFVESGPKALQIDFLEHVLLPPWSNGFILTLILLSTFLIRTDREEKDEEKIFNDENKYLPSPAWGNEFIKDYLRSTAVFVIMILVTALVYLILGSIDAAVPLLGIILLGLLILIRKQQQPEWLSRILKPILTFFGLASFFAMIVVGVLRYGIRSDFFISPISMFFWIALGLEGLLVFYLLYIPQFNLEQTISPQTPSEEQNKYKDTSKRSRGKKEGGPDK